MIENWCVEHGGKDRFAKIIVCPICELIARIEKLENSVCTYKGSECVYKKEQEEKKEVDLTDIVKDIYETMDVVTCEEAIRGRVKEIRDLALKKTHYAINAHKFSGHDSVQTYIDLIKKALENL